MSSSTTLSYLASGRNAGEADKVDKWVATILSEVDEHYCLKPMPSKPLTAEFAKNRLKSVVDSLSKLDEPLPALAELRYYQVQHLLTAGELLPVYDRILNGKGGVLLRGSPADRKALLDAWLGLDKL
jgi:hypothetical protein